MPKGKKVYSEKQRVRLFWSKVRKTRACWLWQGGRQSHGYGEFNWPPHRTKQAHRLAWLLTCGPIPPGMYVLHHCDNPSCVRPDHLFLGTPADNMTDMVAKGRDPRGERAHAAKLTWGQVEEMRRLHTSGLSYAEIGRRFNVKDITARRAIIGKTWKPFP
jgi:hypothetical protein